MTEPFVNTTIEWDRQSGKNPELKDAHFEIATRHAKEILEGIKKTEDPNEIEKILPSWEVLNRLHRAVSSLLEYHH